MASRPATGLADSLETIASEVAELEDYCHELTEQLGQARTQLGQAHEQLVGRSDDFGAQWELDALMSKLADLKRGLATLDEVYDEAGL